MKFAVVPPPEIGHQIKLMRESGFHITEIASSLKVSYRKVEQWIQGLPELRRTVDVKERRWTAERQTLLAKMVDEGKSRWEIAKYFDCTASNINRRMNQYKITTPTQRILQQKRAIKTDTESPNETATLNEPVEQPFYRSLGSAPLPPMHPQTWALLMELTPSLLEAMPKFI